MAAVYPENIEKKRLHTVKSYIRTLALMSSLSGVRQPEKV